MERRLLIHHARLLHALYVAAMRVATSDYRTRYAAAVKAALVPAALSTSPTHALLPCVIPRSAVWARDGAAVDAVAQAEERLARWSAQWHRDVCAWHAVDADNPSAATGSPSAGPAEGYDLQTQVQNLLLQGSWASALSLLTSTAASDTTTATPPVGGECADTVFSPAALRHRRRTWLRPHAAASFPRLPASRATAAVTAVELRLLRSPPSEGLRIHDPSATTTSSDGGTADDRGEKDADGDHQEIGAAPSSAVLRLRRRLWVLQHLSRTLPPSLIHFAEAKRTRGGGGCQHEQQQQHVRYVAALPRPYMFRGESLERLPWFPLCVLGQALQTVSDHLRTSSSGDSVAAFSMVDVEAAMAEALRSSRRQLSPALFFYDPVDYAALTDYVHLLFVSVGSTMTARTAAAITQQQRQRQQRRDCGLNNDEGARRNMVVEIERVFAATAIALLRPPEREAYAAPSATAAATDEQVEWTELLGCVEFDSIAAVQAAVSERAATPASAAAAAASQTSADITATRRVSPRVFQHLCDCVQSRRNYHNSLYCETLSHVCDGAGLALRELTRVLLRRRPASSKDEKTLDTDTPVDSDAASDVVVVLAPESAAAVATALLLQRLAQPSSDALSDSFPSVLFFATPHTKAYAVSSYFKGIYHPSFFQRVCVAVKDGAVCTTGPALVLPVEAWETSAAARLVGRSLRRVDRYPTRTTEAFVAPRIRGDDVGEGEAHAAPPLMIDLYTMDLQTAVAYFRGRDDHTDSARKTKRVTATAAVADGVIAAPPQLPYGLHAVYKPAEVNCTLHALYPNLVYPFLSRSLPWRGSGEEQSAGEDTVQPRTLPQLVVPSLHQQGLVNRIDVGTSGVVLVARDAAALSCAVDAMVRRHQMRKTYRALVQRWPPLEDASRSSTGVDTKAPLFAAAPFLSALPSTLICAPVFAAGATASQVPRLLSQTTHTVSAVAAADDDREQYSRLRTTLHDRRPALTRYRVLEWFEASAVAYVEVALDSGRRHQIRQHFAQLGFPLVGDARYHAGVAAGTAGTSFGLRRAALHAYAVDLLVTAEDKEEKEEEEEAGRVVVQAPLPADMLRALQQLRAAEKAAREKHARRG